MEKKRVLQFKKCIFFSAFFFLGASFGFAIQKRFVELEKALL